ncbi:MAG: hypothetical protein JJT96_08060 [Opitutales bacterium]|nr:hypothetical protein [Opitutales bacterium]
MTPTGNTASRFRLRLAALLFGCAAACTATTIDLDEAHAWSPAAGWLDWRGHGNQGAVMGRYVCEGFVWAPNIGWIHLGNGLPADGIHYANHGPDTGLNVFEDYRLRGLAWNGATGWIHFEEQGNPRIDPLTGRLFGYAWSPNLGWINLQGGPGIRLRTRYLHPGRDSDNDGLPDAYELLLTNRLDVLHGDLDSDGDGVSDRDEYLAGTDPLDPASHFRILLHAREPEEGLIRLGFTSVPDRLYTVQLSTTGLEAGHFQPLSLHRAFAGDPGVATFRALADPGTPRHFIKVEARLPLSPP